MLKEEIVEKISKYFKLTSYEAEKIYEDVFSIIVSGVKDDNVVDLTNFGEFISKQTNGNGKEMNGYKKTVEFLPLSSVEDELRHAVPFSMKDYSQSLQAPVYDQPVEHSKPVDTTFEPQPETPKVVEEIEAKAPVAEENKPNPLEEELMKKREEIISRMSKPNEVIETSPAEQKTSTYEFKPSPTFTPSKIEEPQTSGIEAFKTPEPERKDLDELDSLSKKSFSDFLSETHEEKPPLVVPVPLMQPSPEPIQSVIPPSVVELHQEITSSTPVHEVQTYPTQETPPKPIEESVNGNGSSGEYRATDNSYYIWYKDVEANATETQNLSYEYELLYQATKEAEYKSKLKIYVSTFIVFFSIVLVLLIFSPVIYKVFFKPVDAPPPKVETLNGENPPMDQSSTGTDNSTQQQTFSGQNTTGQTQTDNGNVTPPVTQQNTSPDQSNANQNNTNSNPPQQQQPQQETQKQEPQQQQQPPPQEQKQTQPPPQQQTTQPKLDGVTKNAMGWIDDKFKVIYVQLDNGKFTIQESAWDSDAKASKRISTVDGYKISGISGNVVKADLGDKGVWYRARFGEFSTIEEARSKAEELRNKEKFKLQASLLFFLLYT